ncbi:MAG: 1-acyl-sn-glycerol-3-phosphate acyltransferase, partial [Myxococcota bacterium]
FRRSGAFFLRRSFRGDPLYATMFRHYLIRLLEEGAMIEFFPEGTRSRTGKALKPRYGMVQMILDAVISGHIEHLLFQPISVGYEKIIEGGSYRRESMGADKEAESAASLLKASTVLTSNYGRVYIEFSEPITLADYMKRHQVDRDTCTPEQLRRLGVRLAHRIMYDIAEVTPVTPTSLVALAILNAPAEIDRRYLQIEVGFVLQMLLDPARSTRLSRPLRDALEANAPDGLLESIRTGEHHRHQRSHEERRADDETLGRAVAAPLTQALALLERNKSLTTTTVEGEVFYSAHREQRTELNYYKNNVVHFFVPEALLCCALLTEANPGQQPLDEVHNRTLFLSKLFRYEFLYRERQPGDNDTTRSRSQFEATFFATLEHCQERGWLTWTHEPSTIDLGPQTAPALAYMRSLVLPWVEAYAFVSQRLGRVLPAPTDDGGWMTEKALMRELLRQGQLAHARGDLLFFESLSKTTYLNAVRLFTDFGIIDVDHQPRG